MKAADFIAFDTETATAQLNSLCQVGFVVVCKAITFIGFSLPGWGGLGEGLNCRY